MRNLIFLIILTCSYNSVAQKIIVGSKEYEKIEEVLDSTIFTKLEKALISGKLGKYDALSEEEKDQLKGLSFRDIAKKIKYNTILMYKGKPFGGELIAYWENDKLKGNTTFKKGLAHGAFSSWFKNGQLSDEGNYKDGKEDGLLKKWYENGQLRFEGNYKDGKEDGLHKSWFENGQLDKEVNWQNGLLYGTKNRFMKNGRKISEENYKNDKEDGVQLGYATYYSGNVVSEKKTFKDGVLDGPYYKVGIYDEQFGDYKNGNKHGVWTYDNSSSLSGVILIEKYNNGSLLSKKCFNENGEIDCE